MKTHNTMKVLFTFLLTPIVCFITIEAMAHEDEHGQQADSPETHSHEHQSEEEHQNETKTHHHEEQLNTEISPEIRKTSGLTTGIAKPQELTETIRVYGALASGPEHVSHVRSRFVGLVRSVNVTVGDQVSAGDVLAEIESNNSLKNYEMRAPISGRILQRHANKGEVTTDQVLFSIADFDTLWAELRIYPLRRPTVAEGQNVSFAVNSQTIKSSIEHLIPVLDKPYLIARVKIQNEHLTLSPGILIEADIETSRYQTPLAVDKRAVHELAGKRGVFEKQGDVFSFKALALGREDNNYFEVLGGLEEGSEYAIENSYLLKADIEKSEAEHSH